MITTMVTYLKKVMDDFPEEIRGCNRSSTMAHIFKFMDEATRELLDKK